MESVTGTYERHPVAYERLILVAVVLRSPQHLIPRLIYKAERSPRRAVVAGVSCDDRAVHFGLAVDEICKMLFRDAHVYIGAQSAVFRLLDLDISLCGSLVAA